MTELLQSQEKTLMDEDLLLVDAQSKSFLEMESLLVKNVIQIVDMTTKDLECYISLVDKAVAAFESIDSNFQSSAVGRMLWKGITCYRQILCNNVTDVANFIAAF